MDWQHNIVHALLEACKDESKDGSSSTVPPLLKTIGQAQADRVQEFLQWNPPEKVNDTVDDAGRGPYVYAIAADCFGIVRLLHKHGVTARVVDNDGQCPLAWAATLNRVAIARYLLTNDLADANVVDHAGVSPLHWASIQDSPALVQVLVRSAGKALDTQDQLQALLACQDDQGLTALHWAAQSGRARVVRELLKCGIDPTIRDTAHYTALHHLCLQATPSTVDHAQPHPTNTAPRTERAQTDAPSSRSNLSQLKADEKPTSSRQPQQQQQHLKRKENQPMPAPSIRMPSSFTNTSPAVRQRGSSSSSSNTMHDAAGFSSAVWPGNTVDVLPVAKQQSLTSLSMNATRGSLACRLSIDVGVSRSSDWNRSNDCGVETTTDKGVAVRGEHSIPSQHQQQQHQQQQHHHHHQHSAIDDAGANELLREERAQGGDPGTKYDDKSCHHTATRRTAGHSQPSTQHKHETNNTGIDQNNSNNKSMAHPLRHLLPPTPRFSVSNIVSVRNNSVFAKRLKRFRRRRYRVGTAGLPSKCKAFSFVDCAVLLLRSVSAQHLLTALDAKGRLALHLAAAHNRIDVLEVILCHPSTDCGATDTMGRTPLHWACAQGCAEAVHILMCAGADAHQSDTDGFTACHHAAARSNFDCVRVLLAHDPSVVSTVDTQERTPLVWTAALAGAVCVSRCLVQAGADIHAFDVDGLTPLAACIIAGRVSVLRTFIEQQPCLFMHTEMPLILLAASSSQPATLGVLLDYRAFLTQDDTNDADKSQAIERTLGTDTCDEGGLTPLMYAANYNDAASLDMLLRHGSDVTLRDEQGLTAVHWAAAQGAVTCLQALLAHPGTVVNILDATETRSTPLDYAAVQLEQLPQDSALAQVCDVLVRHGGESSVDILSRAAILIQRNWRTYRARTEFVAKRQAASTIASWFRHIYARKVSGGETTRAHAVLTLQAAFRGLCVRRRYARDIRDMWARIRRRQRTLRARREQEVHDARLRRLRREGRGLSEKERRATLMRLQRERSRKASTCFMSQQHEAEAEARAKQELANARMAQLEERFAREKHEALQRLRRSEQQHNAQLRKEEEQRTAQLQRMRQVADMKRVVSEAHMRQQQNLRRISPIRGHGQRKWATVLADKHATACREALRAAFAQQPPLALRRLQDGWLLAPSASMTMTLAMSSQSLTAAGELTQRRNADNAAGGQTTGGPTPSRLQYLSLPRSSRNS